MLQPKGSGARGAHTYGTERSDWRGNNVGFSGMKTPSWSPPFDFLFKYAERCLKTTSKPTWEQVRIKEIFKIFKNEGKDHYFELLGNHRGEETFPRDGTVAGRETETAVSNSENTLSID